MRVRKERGGERRGSALSACNRLLALLSPNQSVPLMAMNHQRRRRRRRPLTLVKLLGAVQVLPALVQQPKNGVCQEVGMPQLQQI